MAKFETETNIMGWKDLEIKVKFDTLMKWEERQDQHWDASSTFTKVDHVTGPKCET
jgi:hypothetical protein